jgi:ketol-acid reductoisomerase
VGIIGWGSQAPAQAQNMKESFAAAGVDIKVSIGLRQTSPSCDEARACGFSEEDGTLGEVFDVISRSDFVIMLISDGAQSRLYPKVSLASAHVLFLHFRNVGVASFPIFSRPCGVSTASSCVDATFYRWHSMVSVAQYFSNERD